MQDPQRGSGNQLREENSKFIKKGRGKRKEKIKRKEKGEESKEGKKRKWKKENKRKRREKGSKKLVKISPATHT